MKSMTFRPMPLGGDRVPQPIASGDNFRPMGAQHSGPVTLGATARMAQQADSGYLEVRVVPETGAVPVGGEVTVFWPDATQKSYVPDNGKAGIIWEGDNLRDRVVDVVLTPPDGWRPIDREYTKEALLGDYWETRFTLERIPVEGTPGEPSVEGDRAVGGAVSKETLLIAGGVVVGGYILAQIFSG